MCEMGRELCPGNLLLWFTYLEQVFMRCPNMVIYQEQEHEVKECAKSGYTIVEMMN